MATVQLADIYVPVPFNNAVDRAAIEMNRFAASGILGSNDALNAAAAVGGVLGELPFYNPLDISAEPNYTTDNPATLAVPDKITSAKQVYRRAMMHKSWSVMDLSIELSMKDPFKAITDKIGQYWATIIQKRVISSALGVLADNVAGDAADMRFSIATDAVAAITDAERISADAVISAKQTLGDHAGMLSAIAMHSVIYSRLQRQNLITFIPNARGEVNIPTYLGYEVIVDDSMPAVAGVNRITYTSILFAKGAIANGKGAPDVPSEMERLASTGNGGGQTIIHTRKSEIIHPYGFSTVTAPAGQSQTLAELANANAWNRVVVRKNVGMAFLQTNG